MADRNAAAGPPTGTPRYSDRDRKRDYRQGRADARRHLPLVPRQPGPAGQGRLALPPDGHGQPTAGEAPTVEPTPFLTELYHLRNQILAELFATYLGERTRLLDQLRDADGRREHLLTELDAAQSQLEGAATPLTEEESTRRHFGEVAVGHPEELVRRRRTRERQREVTAAEQRRQDITRRLHEAGVAAGHAKDALDDQLKATQAHGHAINSYFEQRKANYLNGLAHRHHRGPEMLRALALTDPGLPEWLTWNTNGLEGA
jgi:hypothetical protein